MAQMNWNDKMSVGVEEMDGDHQELIALLNEIDASVAADQSRDATNEIIDRLMKSVKAHFDREQDLLEKSGFAGAAAHHREHDEMLRTARDWQAHFKDASFSKLSLEAVSGFQSWLDNHIQGADMLYGPHLNAMGIR
jgi:hemerythrin